MGLLDKKPMVIGTICAIAIFIVGILIGHFATSKSGSVNPNAQKREGRHVEDAFEAEQDMIKEAIDSFDSQQIRNYLKYLTDEPHIAALERDRTLTRWIKDTWEQSGLDRVELAEYNFYLSWPNQTNPNKVFLMDERGQVKFTSKHKEEELRPGDDHPKFVHAFNGYSPAGDVTGEVVYVNYGRLQDFDELGN